MHGLSLRSPNVRPRLQKQMADALVSQVEKKKVRGRPFHAKDNPSHSKGRPKGKANKITQFALTQRYQLAKSGITPLEFLVGVVRDEKMHIEYRIDAAKAAAPYLHKRMPIAIEGGDPNKPITFEVSALQGLSVEEKMTMLTLFEKMALSLPAPKVIEAVVKEIEDEDESESSNIS